MKRRLLVMIALCMALVCTCMFCTAGAEDTGSPEAAETVQSTETGEEPADAESADPAEAQMPKPIDIRKRWARAFRFPYRRIKIDLSIPAGPATSPT